MNTKSILTSTFLLTSPLLAVDPLYRVAFDLGSGKIKMQAALVDPSSLQIVQVMKSSEIQIFLREAIDQDHNSLISEEMEEKLLFGIKELQKQATFPDATFKSLGIGTEPFRIAKNGLTVLTRLEKETGIKLFCLTPEEEALLGVQSLIAEKKVGLLDSFISLEFGGGSMQIAHVNSQDVEFFNKSLGKVPVKNHILRNIQEKDPFKTTSPNPISQKEANSTLAWLEKELEEAPLWIEKNPNLKVVGLGAIFPNIKKTLKKAEFTKAEVFSILSQRIDKTDKELIETFDFVYQKKANPEFFVSDLLFLYAVMEKLKIEKIIFADLKGPGSTSGLLIDEPKWQ